MANDATITFVGTVMQEPTSRQVNSSNVFSMKVAVQTTKKQEISPQPASDIYDVAVWGKLGEGLLRQVKAKTKVWVTGDFLVGEPWTDRQGKEHTTLKVTANKVKVLSGGNPVQYNNNKPAPAEEEDPF